MLSARLPAGARIIRIDNVARRNALSLQVLRSLRQQLIEANTTKLGALQILPSFTQDQLSRIEKPDESLRWLVDADVWRQDRAHLPKVLVLSSEGPVFSSGHDLKELRKLGQDEVKETFALCAEVMRLIRRSPTPVIGAIQGLATAAGAQLALATDIPIALATTHFRLPGATIGLPCTSPSTAFSRRLSSGQVYRMLATAEPVRADEMHGAVDVITPAEETPDAVAKALNDRVVQIATRLSEQTGGQSNALGKWAFLTQLSITGSTSSSGGDGFEEAASWAGRVMAIHARCKDATQGMDAFLHKRSPEFRT